MFHDDQHGTAIVVLAALTNALRVVGKEIGDVRIVMSGAGAAGSAILRAAAGGRRRRTSWSPTSTGVIHRGRAGLDRVAALARREHQQADASPAT